MSDREFDVVIIGAGLGGLECACILGREGYKVCVLEKNQQLGGSLQVFSREKTLFDTGVHYIGGLSPGQNLHTYFSYLGIMDKLKLHRMDEDGFDLVSFPGDPIDYPHAQGHDNFVRRLSEFFPHERAGIERYRDEIERTCRLFPLYNVEYSDAQEWRTADLSQSARERIHALVADPLLRNVLAGTNALYAGEGNTTPFYVHALVVNTYIDSAYRCVDGGSQIAKFLAHNARASGATILNRKTVSGFRMGPSGVEAVRTEDGDEFRCRWTIANIHPRPLLEMIAPGHVRPAYRSRINALENTVSTFTVHLVMRRGTFPYLNHNHYHIAVPDIWDAVDYSMEDWPSTYMLSTPRTSRDPDHAEAVIVMAYMRWDEVAQWAHTHNTVVSPADRGPDYAGFKRRREEQVIAMVERKFPGIRSCIESVYSSSPLSFRDFIGAHEGTMYGIRKVADDAMRTFIPPRTRVGNLLLTGQNMNLHGMLGVTVGAALTCSELVGRQYLIEKIRRGG